MHLPKNKFSSQIRSGTVLDGLLEDGLVQYIVDAEGLKLKLTPEGHDFFTREMNNQPRPRGKSFLRYLAMAVFFVATYFYYRFKSKKG